MRRQKRESKTTNQTERSGDESLSPETREDGEKIRARDVGEVVVVGGGELV